MIRPPLLSLMLVILRSASLEFTSTICNILKNSESKKPLDLTIDISFLDLSLIFLGFLNSTATLLGSLCFN